MRTTTPAWLAATLFAVACGAGGNDGSGADETSPPSSAMPGTPATSPATSAPSSTAGPSNVPCGGHDALQGDLDWSLTVSGITRTAHVHLPKVYDPTKATPVVLNFHGLGSNGTEEMLLTGMNAKADAAQFIAVHPEGTTASWNAGTCCGVAGATEVDDVGFVAKLIDELESKLCVDARRVFATGMSNGGFFAHRLACEMSSRIAAIAPVAGVMTLATCKPTRPMSVFQFHGTLDALVPYDGNADLGLPSVMTTLTDWAARSGCSTMPTQTSVNGDVTCVTFPGCQGSAEVNLCTVAGGGHTWPGGLPVPALGTTTTDIVATDVMWDFFVKHPLPLK